MGYGSESESIFICKFRGSSISCDYKFDSVLLRILILSCSKEIYYGGFDN